MNNPLTERARELLAAEYERDCRSFTARQITAGHAYLGTGIGAAIRAIEAALRLPAGVDGWVMVPRWKLERAAKVLDDDGDEHGVGRDISAMLAAAPRQGPDGGEVA